MLESAIFGGDKLNALSALLVYVYRAKLCGVDYNQDMINEFITSIKSNNVEVNNVKVLITGLMNGEIDKNTLLDAITLNLDKESVYTSKLKQLIKADMPDDELKKYIKTTTPMIIESTKLNSAYGALNRASYKLNTTHLDDGSRRELLLELRDQLGVLENTEEENDVMDMVDVANGGILKNLEKSDSADNINLALGWDALNTGVSGYLSTGEFGAIEAQQHNNKTGFTMSIFLQTILNNRVVMPDGRKPTWLWISLEDQVSQIVIKMFIYLYFRMYKRMPNEEELANKPFIDKFFRDEIAKTGHEIILYRIDPEKFSLGRFKRMVKTYENAGKKIVCTVVDYLEKAYTDGTLYNTGATGSGVKNMVTKFRTYIQEKNILFITPWQLSTESNNLTRGGITDKDFVKAAVSKNYTQHTKGLAQELDFEILIHLCRIGGKPYQAVQVGKLKRPSAPEPKEKYMLIPFEDSVRIGKARMLGPLMEDCSATEMIIRDDDSGNGMDL